MTKVEKRPLPPIPDDIKNGASLESPIEKRTLRSILRGFFPLTSNPNKSSTTNLSVGGAQSSSYSSPTPEFSPEKNSGREPIHPRLNFPLPALPAVSQPESKKKSHPGPFLKTLDKWIELNTVKDPDNQNLKLRLILAKKMFLKAKEEGESTLKVLFLNKEKIKYLLPNLWGFMPNLQSLHVLNIDTGKIIKINKGEIIK